MEFQMGEAQQLKEPEGSTAHNSCVSQSYMYIMDMIIYKYMYMHVYIPMFRNKNISRYPDS